MSSSGQDAEKMGTVGSEILGGFGKETEGGEGGASDGSEGPGWLIEAGAPPEEEGPLLMSTEGNAMLGIVGADKLGGFGKEIEGGEIVIVGRGGEGVVRDDETLEPAVLGPLLKSTEGKLILGMVGRLMDGGLGKETEGGEIVIVGVFGAGLQRLMGSLT
jgi:hypothetical protein